VRAVRETYKKAAGKLCGIGQAMGAREAAFFGAFGATRPERSDILQPFAGVSGGERQKISYKKVYLFIAYFYVCKSRIVSILMLLYYALIGVSTKNSVVFAVGN